MESLCSFRHGNDFRLLLEKKKRARAHNASQASAGKQSDRSMTVRRKPCYELHVRRQRCSFNKTSLKEKARPRPEDRPCDRVKLWLYTARAVPTSV